MLNGNYVEVVQKCTNESGDHHLANGDGEVIPRQLLVEEIQDLGMI